MSDYFCRSNNSVRPIFVVHEKDRKPVSTPVKLLATGIAAGTAAFATNTDRFVKTAKSAPDNAWGRIINSIRKDWIGMRIKCRQWLRKSNTFMSARKEIIKSCGVENAKRIKNAGLAGLGVFAGITLLNFFGKKD